MNFFHKVAIIIVLMLFVNESKANTLLDSLSSAYLNNPKLNAERASVRAAKEDKREAYSDFLPSVTVSGYVSEQDNTKGNSSDSHLEPSEQSVLVEQKIFQGFGGVANLKKKKYEFELAEFELKKVEQEILLLAAEVHVDILLNRKKVEINEINIDLLDRQVETDKNRLERGEISLTDLSQSEASLAGAKAKLIAAKNDLIASRVNFEKIIGKKPLNNIQDPKKTKIWLPESLAQSYRISEKENPDLQIAILEFEKSQQDVLIAASDLSPSATLSYEIAEQDDFSSTVSERTQQTVTATASWPIFSGGSNVFSLRESQELRNSKQLLLENTKKIVNTEVTNAWSNYQSSKGVLDSIRSQVKAAEIANEGISLEYESGSSNRTTLDVIQSRAILLDSKVDLATSERNFFISQFKLLSSVGRLTAQRLNLDK